jgi:hypothetical protein
MRVTEVLTRLPTDAAKAAAGAPTGPFHPDGCNAWWDEVDEEPLLLLATGP